MSTDIKGFGFQIKVMPNAFQKKGEGMLMMHPEDYEAYVKRLKEKEDGSNGENTATNEGSIRPIHDGN